MGEPGVRAAGKTNTRHSVSSQLVKYNIIGATIFMTFHTQIHTKKFGKKGFRNLQGTMSHRPLTNTSSLKITAAYCSAASNCRLYSCWNLAFVLNRQWPLKSGMVNHTSILMHPCRFPGGTSCTCYTCTSPNVCRASLKGVVSWDKIGFLSTALVLSKGQIVRYPQCNRLLSASKGECFIL